MQIEMSVNWNMAALVIVLIQIPLLFVFALNLVLSSMLMEELVRVSSISQLPCWQCTCVRIHPYREISYCSVSGSVMTASLDATL